MNCQCNENIKLNGTRPKSAVELQSVVFHMFDDRAEWEAV